MLLLIDAPPDNVKMLLYVVLRGRQLESGGQTRLGASQLPALHMHHTQVVVGLHMARIVAQDGAEVLLGRIQVLEVVDVDISHEDKALAVGRVVLE